MISHNLTGGPLSNPSFASQLSSEGRRWTVWKVDNGFNTWLTEPANLHHLCKVLNVVNMV